MRVLFLPDYRTTNPYQAHLADALVPHGVTVAWGKNYGFRSILNAARLPARPDLLHLHWTTPFWFDKRLTVRYAAALRFLVELYLVQRSGLKIVWTVHNLHTHENNNPAFEYWLNHLVCRLSDAVVVHCEAAQSLVDRHFRLSPHLSSKVKVIEHGHFIDTYRNETTTAQARRYLGFDQGEFIFLYFGQIRAYKGVIQLIRAFRELKYPSARLLIVGQPANSRLREQIIVACQAEKKIYFSPRFIPDDEIQLYIKVADIVVLPFQEVLTSSTVILAMSFGKPLLVPNIGCLQETIGPDGAIYYYPDNPNGLRQALEQARVSDLFKMGQYNSARVRQFDWQQTGKKTYLLYKSCQCLL